MPMIQGLTHHIHQEFGFSFSFDEIEYNYSRLFKKDIQLGKPVGSIEKVSLGQELEYNFVVMSIVASNCVDSCSRVFVEATGNAFPLAGVTFSSLLVHGRKIVIEKPKGIARGQLLKVKIEICDEVPKETVITVGGIYKAEENWK